MGDIDRPISGNIGGFVSSQAKVPEEDEEIVNDD